jgi:hypothetical protein
VFLIGIGPLARWKQAELPALARGCAGRGCRGRRGARTGWLAGRITLGATLGVLMSVWIVALDRDRPVAALRRPHAGVRQPCALLPRPLSA